MATQDGRAGARLIDRLEREPHRFEFFQAVLLLERLARRAEPVGPRAGRSPVGREHPPDREFVRFRAWPSLGFPPSEVARLRRPPARPGDPAGADPAAPELSIHAFGLTGPSGALPHHYTAYLLRRIREKDDSLRDFLDLFNHRLISLFYRAWEKYRLPPSYERRRSGAGGEGEDPASQAIACLVGLGTFGLRGRLQIDDEAFLHYAGHFAHHPRSAAALESILADYFELPVRVRQAVGQWLHLDLDDRSRLTTHAPGRGNNRLGEGAIAGAKVWDVQGKFRLEVGPLDADQFHGLMPDGDMLRPLGQMARRYAGPEFDIEVQPILKPEAVPWCRPGGGGPDAPRLGWNTWVRREPFAAPTTGPTFSLRPSEEILSMPADPPTSFL